MRKVSEKITFFKPINFGVIFVMNLGCVCGNFDLYHISRLLRKIESLKFHTVERDFFWCCINSTNTYLYVVVAYSWVVVRESKPPFGLKFNFLELRNFFKCFQRLFQA